MKSRIFLIVISCLLPIMAVGGLGICVALTEYPDTATKENVTVQIVGAEWSGSGFMLEDGIIVTAAHVMRDVVDAKAVFSDGTEVILDPNTYYISGDFDLAFATIANYVGPTATFGTPDSITIGAAIEICGYPLGEKHWHSFGSIARLVHNGHLDMDIDGVPGDSGGPVFLDNEVVGILTCGFTNTQMCSGVDISAIKAELSVYEVINAR